MTLASGVTLPVQEISAVCRGYGVKELAVFGSVTREDLGPQSDIDVLVEFQADARIGLLRLADLNEELEGLLGRRVDLVTKPGLKPHIRPQVLREAQVVYAA